MSKRRLRVVHVLEALEGGTSRHLCDLVEHVSGVEHIVVIPATRVGGVTDELAQPRLRAAGADVRLLGMRRTPWAVANVKALVGLARLIRRERPDLVHGHSSIGGLLARLAAIGSGVPVLYTPNGITQVRAGRIVERALRRRTRVLVAVSAGEAAVAAALRLAPAERIVVIPNGIELELPPPVDLREQLALAADTPLVGTIARLVPQKAPEDFVTACSVVAAAVPDARFVLIGSGALERAVEVLIGSLGLGARLTRIPVLPGAAGALGQLDVFVLASRFEGGPYAVLEAMRAGTPVVATDVVGSADAVEDGVSGVLVPPGDAERLGQEIVALLADPERRAQLGAAAQLRVAQHFDVRAMGVRTQLLYEEVAGS